ncbi:hypothetical protein LCGC14_2559350, partial [marine sediment metagenome]
MTLRQKQSIFARCIAQLIIEIYARGYEVTLGEAYRRKGVGWKHSLHRKRLAKDLNLFLNGRYLTSTKAHEQFGIWWKALHKENEWGGDFHPADGNHYSRRHNGIA